MSEAVTAPRLSTSSRADLSALRRGIPELRGDHSLAFLAEGYPFGHRRFEKLGVDAFRTRLMGREVTMLRGHDAARFFYEGELFDRVGAMPRSVLHSLQDEKSVQTLVGEDHRERKGLFTRMLDEQGDAALADAFAAEWDRAQGVWAQGPVSLLTASAQVLTDAVLRWLRIDEPAQRRRMLAHQNAAMIDGAGSFGPRNWHGRVLRLSTESWARDLVRRYRSVGAPAGSPIRVLLDAGLSDDVAAIELLNLLRPTVAVSRFIAFAALALHQHPTWHERVRDDDAAVRAFTQEVRRTTPFFPAIGGRARAHALWRDVAVSPGDWVILDLFATNRHPGEWADAGSFDPARFEGKKRAQDAQNRVVAQGAGDIARTHRCPGEPATIALLDVAVKKIANADWLVPDQDLRVDLRRLPATPGARGMLVKVRN